MQAVSEGLARQQRAHWFVLSGTPHNRRSSEHYNTIPACSFSRTYQRCPSLGISFDLDTRNRCSLLYQSQRFESFFIEKRIVIETLHIGGIIWQPRAQVFDPPPAFFLEPIRRPRAAGSHPFPHPPFCGSRPQVSRGACERSRLVPIGLH